MSRIKLSTVELEIGNRRVRLSIEQAKELKDLLNDTFGEERVIYRDWWKPYYPYQVWYGNSSAGDMSISDNLAYNATDCAQASEHWNFGQTTDTLTFKAA